MVGKRIRDDEDDGDEDKERESADSGNNDEELFEEENEWEVDEALHLPPELRSLSVEEKKELLAFKNAHSELDYEAEIEQRSEAAKKKRTMNRLQEMTRVKPVESKAGGKKPRDAEDSEEDLFNSENEEEEEEEDAAEDDDDDDDLFDSDEEEQINTRTPALRGRRTLNDVEDGEEATPDEAVGKSKPVRTRREPERGDDVRRERRPRESRDKDKEEGPRDPAELKDVLDLQTKRVHLEKYLFEPYFEQVVIGSFVKIQLTYHKSDGEEVKVYKVCVVEGVGTHKRAYKLPDSRLTTDKMLTLAIGSSTVRRRLDAISNHSITKHEFEVYQQMIESSRSQRMPSHQELVEMTRARNDLVKNYVYTAADIDKKAESISQARQVIRPKDKIVLKDTLAKDLEDAQSSQDYERIELLQKQKAAMELEERVEGGKLSKRSVALNERNKTQNYMRDINAGTRRRDAQKEVKEGPSIDPFARRETRPKIIWHHGKERVDGKEYQHKGKIVAGAAPSEEVTRVTMPVVALGAQWETGADMSAQALSIMEIRSNVKRRLGFDPVEYAEQDKKQRYLSVVCGHLPPLGSEARSMLRKGLSLADALKKIGVQNPAEE